MKKALIFLLLFSVLIFGIVISSYFILISIPSSNQEDVVVVIKEGSGVDSVAVELKDKKLIKSKLAFKAYLFVNNETSLIQPGEYIFKKTNISKITSKITNPQEKKEEIILTFLEGWTADEMAEYLTEKGISFENEFLDLVSNKDTRKILPDNNYTFFYDKPLTADLEGYLFPDTYRVFADVKPEEIIEKFLDNFDYRITEEMKDEILKKDMKLFEVITLASIVEKEARTKKDKEIVAGIFLNRLEIDQRLESDATVNYVTGKSTTRPTYKDVGVDSLYNTYKYSGLPPGPICNPGLDSIKAVIYPEESDYLFFLNTPSGSIVYNETYEKHLESKNYYYPE